MRLFGGGSFGGFGSGCLGSFGGGSLGGLAVAAYAAALTALGTLFAFLLLAGGGVVHLLHLALFETFGHGGADGVEDELDALGGIIVGGDYEIDVGGVGVGVDHGEDGDTETVGFGHGDALLEDVDNEESRGKTVEVGD